MNSCLYEGTVRHRRHTAPAAELRYPVFMVYLDVAELPGALDASRLFSARHPAPAWFRRADHLGEPSVPLEDAVRSLVAARTGELLDGPVRVLTNLRYLGHCFNPVSLYYCHDRHGRLRATVANVTNTPWGESHAYVLGCSQLSDRGSAALATGRTPKQLHVSPLLGMDSSYEWRLTVPGPQLSLHIASRGPQGQPLFDATLALARRELTREEMRRALLRYPLLSVRILARIYASALRLRLAGAPWHPHPGHGRATA